MAVGVVIFKVVIINDGKQSNEYSYNGNGVNIESQPGITRPLCFVFNAIFRFPVCIGSNQRGNEGNNNKKVA
jgi:hypothetical protein